MCHSRYVRTRNALTAVSRCIVPWQLRLDVLCLHSYVWMHCAFTAASERVVPWQLHLDALCLDSCVWTCCALIAASGREVPWQVSSWRHLPGHLASGTQALRPEGSCPDTPSLKRIYHSSCIQMHGALVRCLWTHTTVVAAFTRPTPWYDASGLARLRPVRLDRLVHPEGLDTIFFFPGVGVQGGVFKCNSFLSQ